MFTKSTELNSNKEKGIALLMFAILLSVLAAIGGYGYFAAMKTMNEANPQMLVTNRAQAMAYTAVAGLQNWYNGQLAACAQAGETGTACPVLNGELASAATQENLSGTPVSVTASVISNTLGQPNGSLIINSTGVASNGITQTMQTRLVTTSSTSTTSSGGSANAINLNGAASFSNSVKLEGNPDDSLAVNGGITTTNSFDGFENIISTQSISFSNSANQANVYSDGNVTLSNSGNFETVEALGNVSVSGGVKVANIVANGALTLSNGIDISGSVTAVDQSAANAGDSISISGGGQIDGTLESDGSIVASGGADIHTVETEGSYTANNGGTVESGEAGGTVIANNDASLKIEEVKGLQVPITPLTPFTVQTVKISATALEGDANVDFLPPPGTASSAIVGTAVVRNENGIPNGNYYLYAARGPNYNTDIWLTTSATNPTTQYKIIQGDSAAAPLSYSDGDWSYRDFANEPSMIPGVVWFDGNVTLTDTGLYDGIIATGTISTSNEETNYAPNFAYGLAGDPECTDSEFSANGSPIYPTNFCTNPYTPASIGNIGLLAGDDLDFSNETKIYGDILAGNVIHSSNELVVEGYIDSGDENGSSSENTFQNSLTVNLKTLPNSFTAQVPGSYSMTNPVTSANDLQVNVAGVRWISSATN